MKKKVRTPKIKAVIFDVGGVLALGRDLGQLKNGRTKGVHEFIVRHINISLDQWFDTIGGIYEGFIIGKILEKDFLSKISKSFSLSPPKLKELLLKAYKLDFSQNKGLHEFALKLKKRRYRIAILSDQHPISKQVVMPKQLYKKFSPVIVSCDVGVRKPNPEIYKITLKKLRLPAKSCLFIDNQVWNLAPAKKLGMKTILFKNNKQLFKQMSKLEIK